MATDISLELGLSTCDRCFQGRHVRCQDRENCGCSWCADTRAALTRRGKRAEAGQQARSATPRRVERHARIYARVVPGPKGMDPRLDDNDKIAELVLELLQRINEELRSAA